MLKSPQYLKAFEALKAGQKPTEVARLFQLSIATIAEIASFIGLQARLPADDKPDAPPLEACG
jgi:hypothetical protein